MPKHVDHAQRRRELMDAAAAVIAAEGIDAATVRRIAAASGCTTGMVTHYFTSKHELIIGAIRQVHRRAGDRMIARRRCMSGVDALRAVLLEALPLDAAREAEWRVWLAFWGVAWTSQLLIEEHNARYALWRRFIRELLAEAARHGHIKRGLDLDAAAAHLIALADGIGLQIIYEPTRLTRQRAVSMIEAQLSQLTTAVHPR
ncbi:MAG: TetR/AcrR family transcriptional regulator [Streptosporangiaceae bacterium]